MLMNIHIELATLKLTKGSEYFVRFLSGGIITVITGLLAARYGPEFGGLFLAFPALFVASATLIEKHEREKHGSKTFRGRQAAALDARGVTIGSIGLIGFGSIVWILLPTWNSTLTLVTALLVWLATSIVIWRLRRSFWAMLSHLRESL
jgi:Protein of unknown function (DUF3147)